MNSFKQSENQDFTKGNNSYEQYIDLGKVLLFLKI